MNIYLFKNPDADDRFHYGYDNMVIVAETEDDAKNFASNIDQYGSYSSKIENFWIIDVEPILLGYANVHCDSGFISGNYTQYNDAWDE